MQNNEFLGTEPVGKLLVKLAVPSITAQLINALYNIVDRIYIGQGVGSYALTGVGVCMPIIMVISAFAALVSMGGAPRASIFMGEKNYDKAEKMLGSCVTLQLFISVVLTAAVLIWNRDLLLLFGASENTIEYASAYMTVYAIGTIFVQLTLGMNAFIAAQGFAKFSMITVVIGAVLNIALDPLFIFTFGMGVRGAALATILSQAVSAVWCVIFLSGKRSVLKLKLANLRPSKEYLGPCVALGLAPFIMQASESVIIVCYNSSLLAYGGDMAVGAMTIMSSVMQFVMLPMQGLGQGAQPISSYNYGAKNPDRVKKVFKLLLIVSLGYSFTAWGIAMLAPNLLASIFTDSAALIEYTSWAIRIYFASSVVFGIQIACQMTFISIGFAKSSIAVALMRKLVLLIPLIYILPNIFPDKVMSVYLAEPVADTLAVTFTAILFAVQFRRALRELR